MCIRSISPIPDTAELHADFLKLYPVIRRHAWIVFRSWPSIDREEAVAEAVAGAFESYLRLKERGKDPVKDFPSVMATFATLHVKDHRHVGGKMSSKDVMSRKAQKRHGFQLLPLQDSRLALAGHGPAAEIAERLQDNMRTPVPDQVAFRIDFPAFLRTLAVRDRRLALFLSVGHSGKEAAARFRISPGRVTQLRKDWQREWLAFCEELHPNQPPDGQGTPPSA